MHSIFYSCAERAHSQSLTNAFDEIKHEWMLASVRKIIKGYKQYQNNKIEIKQAKILEHNT